MGARESKQLFIDYENAIKRVSDTEIQRLHQAFKKSAGVDGVYLSRNAFRRDVLSEGVPSDVVDLLYTTCGGTYKGISFRDLLCGLVLITKGSDEEKIRFLWNLYCNESGTCIVKSNFVQTVNLHPCEIATLFAYSDHLSYEQFYGWISKNRNATILSEWLLLSNCLSLTSELESPTFYQSLAGVTHLEEKDIADLEKEFWCLKNTSQNSQLDLQILGPLFSPPMPKYAVQGLFNAFDENRDGHIDFKELCCGVSAACRGPAVERTRFCFKIFDLDRDGVLNHNEMAQMINVLAFVAKENPNDIYFKDFNKQQVLKDITTFIRHNNSKSTPIQVEDTSYVFTVEDFMMWNIKGGMKLLQPFLDLIFQICHVVLGLRPQCRHMEYDIVRGWLDREVKRKYCVGQFWYLISYDWWLSWLQYTTNTNVICDTCRNSANSPRNSLNSNLAFGIDEAFVCDENFLTNTQDSVDINAFVNDNCSLASNNSCNSNIRQMGSRPGAIDNTNLVIVNSYKNIRTLSGEGGQLKKDTPLVQKRDFELVPLSLWKALNRWYGDNLPLPRQVIHMPDSPHVELELYPLNLKILLHQKMNRNLASTSYGALSGSYGVIASTNGFAVLSASSVMKSPERYLAYTAAFSCLATVQQVSNFLCEQLHLNSEDIRLWHIIASCNDNSAILLDEDNVTLRELQVKDNDQLLLEIRNKDQTWPEELSSLTSNQTSNFLNGYERRLTRTSIMSVQVPGATGLHNLGNTCFMNAALQVLFNTQPLAQYFRQNVHLFELNTTNKLGTRGNLAKRYAELLKEVWSATTRSVVPLKLRFCVTKYAPQFAGGGQHDSQELLEWFLDALHEDLNRVTDKPYSELNDSNGRPDKIVAMEAWTQHHARNNSIIIDLFYGQLKSKVSCLCCGRESVRFDPFSLLSLPLPVENYIYFEILVILLDGSVPFKYGLRVNSESKYYDLKRQLSTMSGLNANLMLICEIWNSQIKQIFYDDEKIQPSSVKELYVYQLPEERVVRSRSNSVKNVHIEKGLKDIQRNSTILNVSDVHTLPSIVNNSVTSINSNDYNNISNNNNNIDNDGLVLSPINADELSTSNSSIQSIKIRNTSFNAIPLSTETINNNFCINNGLEEKFKKISSSKTTTISPKIIHNVPTKNVNTTSALAVNFNDNQQSCNFVDTGDRDGDYDDRILNAGCGNFGDSNRIICDDNDNPDMDEDNDVQISAKSSQVNHSPENTFVDGLHQHGNNRLILASSSKLLVNGDPMSCSYTPSGENSLASSTYDATIDSLPLDSTFRRNSDCPCRLNIDNSTDVQIRLQNLKFIENTGESLNSQTYTISNTSDAGNDIFSRMSSQHFKMGNYLIAVHRKITRQDSYFLSHHKTRPSIFGQPLIIPYHDDDTCKNLYCAVWLQVRRLLSPLPAVTEQANHAADCDDSLGYDFPFSLRSVKSDGLTCSVCEWTKFCRGCEIPCNNDILCNIVIGLKTNIEIKPHIQMKKFIVNYTVDSESINSLNTKNKLNGKFVIAIDWDPTALHLRYQSSLERLWVDHESVGINRKEQTEPVDLDHCLRAFTSEEKLEQWYHCSHCKGKKPATKKLQIWKLPPILIVHLKRFNCVNGKWVKSQKVVNFSFEKFDPTPYLAAVPQETILRYRELSEMKIKNNNQIYHQQSSIPNNLIDHRQKKYLSRETSVAIEASETIEATDLTYNINSPTKGFLNNRFSWCENTKANINNHYNNDIHNIRNNELDNINDEDMDDEFDNIEKNDFVHNVTDRKLESDKAILKFRRQRLVSTSLTKTPIIDNALDDFHQHQLKPGEDKFDPKYKLYAIVSHSGLLDGGHYISYAANPNGNWYCYNDSSCRDLSSRQPNIDPSSAYMLFYEREGLDYEPYLPNIQDNNISNVNLNKHDIEENDNNNRKFCTIA